MSVNLSPIGNGFQFFTNNGEPLTSGKLYTYQAGSSTPLATYTNSAGTVSNTNPIILGVDGRPPEEIWLTYGYNYKFILTDSSDVTLATYDNLYGIVGVEATSVSSFTAGMIMLWSGSIGSVPSGWALCDGNNGTPNLTDKFIVGAGASYAVGGTGGSADSIVVSHTHTATTTASDSGHTHGIAYSGTLGFSGGGGYSGTAFGGAVNQATQSGTANISASTTVNSTGSSGTNANLPPYYALAYIMKT